LSQIAGNWLEFDPEESAIAVRRALPGGCPALAGVPCELIGLIDSIPQKQRDSMPGGVLFIEDGKGQIVRLVVEHGEVRIQWPHLDYSQGEPVSTESVLSAIDENTACINGWARFAGSSERSGELQTFADRFGGLYPEDDMPSECQSDMLYVEFKDANVGPEELLTEMQELAEPPESLQAELEVSSLVPGAVEHDFRLCIRNGRVQATRPSLWQNPEE
jgi:hypothetical protein